MTYTFACFDTNIRIISFKKIRMLFCDWELMNFRIESDLTYMIDQIMCLWIHRRQLYFLKKIFFLLSKVGYSNKTQNDRKSKHNLFFCWHSDYPSKISRKYSHFNYFLFLIWFFTESVYFKDVPSEKIWDYIWVYKILFGFLCNKIKIIIDWNLLKSTLI